MQPVDFTTLTAACGELRHRWLPARLEQVYQRDRYTIAIALRTIDRRGWVDISWHPNAARLCAGDPPPRTPDTFTFSDQLRHQLNGLALVAIEAVAPWERAIDLQFAKRPGDPVSWHLYVEIMGKRSNVILANSDNAIVTPAHQVNEKQSSVRPILTGQPYELPPALTDPAPSLRELQERWIERISLIPGKLATQLLKSYRGLSSHLVKSMILAAGLDPEQSTESLSASDWQQLFHRWLEWLQALEKEQFHPSWTAEGYTVLNWETLATRNARDVTDKLSVGRTESGDTAPTSATSATELGGSVADKLDVGLTGRGDTAPTSATSATELGGSVADKLDVGRTGRGDPAPTSAAISIPFRDSYIAAPTHPDCRGAGEARAGAQERVLHPNENRLNVLELLNRYYTSQLNQQEFKQLHHQLSQKLSNLLGKLRVKAKGFQERLQQSDEADLKRQMADLLMANLQGWEPGMKSITLADFETGEPVTIPLDPEKNAVQNAQALYKRHQKLKRARSAVEPLLAVVQEEIDYLEQVEVAISQLEAYQVSADLQALEEVRDELMQQGYLPDREHRSQTSAPTTDFHRLRSPSGFELLIGRNNRQNDLLSFRLAGDYDLWFHTLEIAGSHVLLRLDPGAVADEADLQFAADLSAYYSRARQSEQVAVVYTQPKHVYKPKGAKPGMVVYKHERIIWGRPLEGSRYLTQTSSLS